MRGKAYSLQELAGTRRGQVRLQYGVIRQAHILFYSDFFSATHQLLKYCTKVPDDMICIISSCGTPAAGRTGDVEKEARPIIYDIDLELLDVEIHPQWENHSSASLADLHIYAQMFFRNLRAIAQ